MAGIHLLKLCVGCESVEHLLDWQARRAAERLAAGDDPRPFHVTRMRPKRAPEILDGGSLFWVVKGLVLCRQRVVALEAVRGRGRHRAVPPAARPAGGPHRAPAAPRRSRAGATSAPTTRRQTSPRPPPVPPRFRRRSPPASPRSESSDAPSRRRCRPRRRRLCRSARRLSAAPASAASKYQLGRDRGGVLPATLSGDMAAIRPLLTDALDQNIEAAAAAGNPAMPPRGCCSRPTSTWCRAASVQTRNAALVEIRRSQPGGAGLVGVSRHRPGDRRRSSGSTTCSSPPAGATRSAPARAVRRHG